MSRPDLVGKHACRLCRHDQWEHNLIVGCPHCRCMATPSEACALTDKELDFTILSAGSYLTGYEPRQETPELDKQSAIIRSGEAATVQAFYDWLRDERGWEIAEPVEGSRAGYYRPVYVQPEQLMADFFGIDLIKIETERRALLDHIRTQQED